MSRSAQGRRWSTGLAAGCALLLVALGSIVLAGWIARVPALIQIQPNLPPMTRNVAASFWLLGVSLLVLALRGPRWVAALCAFPVLVVAGLSYADFAFKLNSGIHEILGPSYINVQLRSPGRMAPITAVSLGVASGSLLAISTLLPLRTGLALSLNGSVLIAFGAVATLYTRPSLAALHTGVGIAIAGVGLVALAWRSAPTHQPTPPWLPLGIAAGMAGLTAALMRALLVGGYPPSAPLPVLVLGIGTLLGPLLAFTVYMAQRAQAQAAALERSQAFLEEAQALSRTGSFWWQDAGAAVTCSKELYRILALPPGQPVTAGALSALLPAPVVHVLADEQGAQGSDQQADCEHTLQTAAGDEKILHVVVHPARHRNGQRGYIGTVQDVTAQRRSEEALAMMRSQFERVVRTSSLGALTGSIAHEVQQPLAAIILNAATCMRMLAADPPNVEGAMETARRTMRDGNRAADVISRLRVLFASRRFSVEPVDLNEAAQDVLALCATELQRCRVHVQLAFGASPLVVRGDRLQLQQVVLNLVLNAAEAMDGLQDGPRELVIRSGAEAGFARLSVQDSGPGFPPGAEPRLFEAFYTTKDEGMGIGLSISRSIIERHDGRLWAAAAPGAGAIFTFCVPLAEPAQAGGRGRVAAGQPG
ncbi:MAG TPA: ATP-binding protein [Ramlibacter sp.]|jgi:signal transduction histidine kinase|nr:ATP-binding protein [Ramlibacter sp.]